MAWYKTSRNWGHLVAGVWFIAFGLIQLVPKLNFEGSATVLAVVAIAAGILLLIGK